MLADGIEAATRALPNPDPEKIDALIRKLVRGRLNDGQLDSSNLTFNDLDKICSAFSTVLTGVFHERIEYPDVAIPPRVDSVSENAPAPASAQPKPAVAPGQPVPPVQSLPQNAAPASPQPKPAVAPGQPVPPVQSVPQNTAPASPQPKSAVASGQPVPPVQSVPQNAAPVSPQPRPSITPGQSVPPVPEEDPLKGVPDDVH